MSPQPSPGSQGKPANDEDLLASAIPIEDIEKDDEALAIVEDDSDASGRSAAPRIQHFDVARTHKEKWVRQPNVSGNGAVHCKTFVAKMRQESLDHLDELINEWLDAHPDCEVKFVTTTVGRLTGKTVEDALVVNLWV
jgi:hypothetical protein